MLDQADRAIPETQQEQSVKQELDNVKEIIDKHVVSCFPIYLGGSILFVPVFFYFENSQDVPVIQT